MPNRYIPKAELEKLEAAYKGYCEYCKYLQKYTSARLQNDHIIPLALKGKNEFANLAKACISCNANKHTFTSFLDPVTNEIVPLFHPRQQDWNDHFQWSEDRLLIEGKTPTGRATVILLDMNTPEIVNLRAVMPKDEHPPRR
ncbi:MAG: HNH endonuclease signature motif containing protein [Bacteroidota bacterium]